jgi:hypothetical protein
MIRKRIPHFSFLLVILALPRILAAGDLLVENLGDGGPGSLRAAIDAANTNPGADVIAFDPGLNGTITLASALPPLSDELTIDGPGADLITVSGDELHQPFSVVDGATVTLSALTISSGHGEFGGAISNEGNLTLLACELSGNTADFSGGAVDNVGGLLVAENCLFSGNTTGEFGFGGAISNDAGGTLSINASTFSNNSADFSGGAIDNIGSADVFDSTLVGNTADFGGAIENAGDLTVRNSTLSGNTGESVGGAIDNFESNATVEFSTLAENASTSGAGIENSGTVTIKNSLVSSGPMGDNCNNKAGGTLNSLGSNFSTDSSCPGFTQVTPGELDLGDLGDNGGPTQTHPLLAGSVAIDAATDCTRVDGSTPVTEDQRGEARPQGSACDSGAFEASATSSGAIFESGFENG